MIKAKKKFKQRITASLLLIFIISSIITVLPLNSTNSSDVSNLPAEKEIFNEDSFNNNFNSLKSSDIFYPAFKYDLSEWWNKTYRFRIGFKIENLDDFDKYQPVDIFFNFQENEHYEGSTRLVSYNATGINEWSNPIPIQLWNITYYPNPNYIQSCTITFIASISALSNQTFFLYYNENMDSIEIPDYNTDFTSVLVGGKLTVTVGESGSLYEAVLQQGLAVSELNKDTYNFHTDKSLVPEKQLSHPDLRLLTHMDENQGTTVLDTSGYGVDGSFYRGDPTWTSGVVKYGLSFDGNDDLSFGAALEGSGDPFNDYSTEFTITLWIKPAALTDLQSNHYTQNCFMAKASDPYNDNFEIGINSGSIGGTSPGTIHVYIDTETRDTYANFGNSGDVSVGEWNFIALRYDSGDVDVKINDAWYTSTAWSGATDLDQAEGSPFTIGSTDHIDTYFNGDIDEVAIYNSALSDQMIEDYKYASIPSTIQSITEIENGQVFSRYRIEWNKAFDMSTIDYCTFYYDYNLWNINREIYFDNVYNSTIASMIPMNTYYDLSGLSQNENFHFYYDGNFVDGLNNDQFISENYTIIHDPIHVATKDTLGVFVAGYSTSDILATITYLNGTVFYDAINDIVRYTPGSLNDFQNNIGGSDYKLIIDFWEYIDNIGVSTPLNTTELIELFDNTFKTLRNPINFYIYEQDSLFYNLKVNVTDIDNNLVPDATVTLWNASNYNENWVQYTDDSGIAIFNRLNNGSYVVNVSYEKYGKEPLTITTPKTIDINDNTVDTFGVNLTEFTNVELTTLNLTLHRYNETAAFKGFLEGAKVDFWIDNGTGPDFIGSENSDENGNVIFRWQNFTSSPDGNVTFTLTWFDTEPRDISALGDLDPSNLKNITLPFYQADSKIVNVTFAPSFDTAIALPEVYEEGTILGELISFQVNYTFTVNETNPTGIIDADVNYNIKIGTQILNIQTLEFNDIGGGLYNLTIDTSNPIDVGGELWESSITYTMEIFASKPGFISKTTAITFVLADKTASLTANVSIGTAYWNDVINLEVHYQDIYADPDLDIEDAIVQYLGIGVIGVSGLLDPLGSGGRYRLVLDTGDFPGYGDYFIQIIADKQNYETKQIILPVKINAINTRINDSTGILDAVELPFGEEKIFYFNYTEADTGLGLSNCEIAHCEWEKEDSNGNVVDSGILFLTNLYDGIYELDFDTHIKEIATYTLSISIGKSNYALRIAIIILKVIPREFSVDSSDIIKVISGKPLVFDIEIKDLLNDNLVNGTEVTVTFRSNNYTISQGDIIDNGDGSYTVTIPKTPDAFFAPQTYTAMITVQKTNYSTKTKTFVVEVKMVEWPISGFPAFYFLMIVGATIAVVGSLAIYRVVQQARIPTFVKKTKKMKKDIKGKKAISDSLLYPSKEEYLVKRLGDRWDMLGLSLENILGTERKKKKILPETTGEFKNLKGGVE
ncbi:MAG: LamG-like jellyroll fold domain-containing protein [Promethearchaeota archaeon]